MQQLLWQVGLLADGQGVESDATVSAIKKGVSKVYNSKGGMDVHPALLFFSKRSPCYILVDPL